MIGREHDLQIYSLYLMQFASAFGFITIVTLLPTYINILEPSGFIVGIFVASVAIARAVAIIPLAWAGDRYDKRALLLLSLLVSIVAFVLFAVIETSYGFIGARLLQGLGMVGTSLLGLAMISELAPDGKRANIIGKYNAWRMVAGVVGTLGAGILYEVAGFIAVFGLLVVLLALSTVGVGRFVEADETSVQGFAFTDLALNLRLITISSFRAQYAISVKLVRNWVPIFAGVSVARGGLAASAIVVGMVVAAEKFTNMICQPRTGRLSDEYGRAMFIVIGGTMYGSMALVVPFAPQISEAVPITLSLPMDIVLTPAIFLILLFNGLLGVADSFREPASMATYADEGIGTGIASSFGLRNVVWLPGNILAPIVGGILMDQAGIEWVFYLGSAAAFTGVGTFLLILSHTHGLSRIAEW